MARQSEGPKLFVRGKRYWVRWSDGAGKENRTPIVGHNGEPILTDSPRQDALEVTWMSPEEAASDTLAAEMEGGRSTLVRQALASVGALR